MAKFISSYLKFSRDPNFNCDEGLLSVIKDDLLEAQKLIIYGTSGVGKSSMANELAHRLIEEGNIVKWIDCRNQSVSDQKLRKFIKITEKSSDRIIFVLDSVSSSQNLEEALESLPSNVFFLITTNEEKLLQSKMRKNEVMPFDLYRAKMFMKRLLKVKWDDDVIEKVVSALSGRGMNEKLINSLSGKGNTVLPLVLRPVIAYINEDKLLKVDFWLKKTKHNEFVDSILDYLHKNSEESMNLLSFIAYIDGIFITLDLLGALLNKNYQEIIFLLKLLGKFSLTKMVMNENSVSGIFIHEKIQENIRELIRKKYRRKENEVILNLCKFIKNTLDSHENKYSDETYNHSLIFVRYQDIISSNTWINLVSVITKHQRKTKQNLQLSINLENQIINKFSSEQNDRIATSINNMGVCFFYLNEFEKAIELYKKSLDMRYKIFANKNRVEFAESYCNIGACYELMGHFNEALDFFNKDYSISLILFGEKHPDTSNSLNNIGRCQYSLRRYESAIEIFTKCLEILEKFYDENDPKILICYSNIGSCFKSIGKHEKTLQWFEKRRDFDPLSIETIENISYCFEELGDIKRALEVKYEALQLAQEIHGEFSEQASRLHSSIGECALKLNEIKLALESFTRCLEIQYDIFSEKNKDVAKTLNNIGMCYAKLGDQKKALEIFEKSIEIFSQLFGLNHVSLTGIYNSVGYCHNSLENYKKALECFEKEMKICTINFGTNHPEVAACYNNMGACHFNMKNFSKAIALYEKGLQLRKQIYRVDNLDIAASLSNIALCYLELGEFDKALGFFGTSLEIRERFHEVENNDLSDLYGYMSECFEKMGEKDKAIEYLQKRLQAVKKLNGNDEKLPVVVKLKNKLAKNKNLVNQEQTSVCVIS